MLTQFQKNKKHTKTTAAIVQKKENKGFSLQDNRASTNAIQLMQKEVVQRNPLLRFMAKPTYMQNLGKGFIPLMHSQYDASHRSPAHQALLDKVPKGQNPMKTFMQENDHASQFPYDGSKSKLGDMGITAHKSFAFGKKLLYGSKQ